MIKWHNRTRSVRISSLLLGEGFRRRLEAPHVLALAASTEQVGRINLPVVCWRLGGEKSYKVAAGEDRIAAELVRNGGDWKATIEVRAFDADDEHDIALVRAHENGHRRHDDRDKWLAGLAASAGREEDDLTQNRGVPDGPEADVDPSSEATAGGGDKGKVAPGSIPAQAPPSPLDPPDNIAQGFDQQAGTPPDTANRNKLLRSNKVKAQDHKVAAQLATAVTGKPVTPAAVKQAAYRERKAKGEVTPRQKHNDSGEPPGALGLEVARGYIDVHASITAAVTRLANLLRKHPELSERAAVDGWLSALKTAAKEIKAATPRTPCVYCHGKGEKARCQACRGQRWLTKAELETAPAELRKAAGF